jgi:hypothetical protein
MLSHKKVDLNNKDVYEQHWLNLPFRSTDFANKEQKSAQQNVWGNPLWTHDDRVKAWRQILGKDFDNVAFPDGQFFIDQWAQAYIDDGFDNPGKDAGDYFDPEQHAGKFNPWTDPDYTGLLPSLQTYAVDAATPWHKSTTDPKAYGYKNPCLNEPLLDTYVPYIAGGVGAVFGALVVPGNYARLMGAATMGGTGYFVAKGIVGWKALQAWAEGDNSSKSRASEIFSIGAPVTIVEAIWELGVVPTKYATQNARVGSLLAAAGLGYFVILPVVEPILTVTGDTFQVLSAPLSMVEYIGTMLVNGCIAHEWNSRTSCQCEDANVKPKLVEALVGPIYGCTGEQKKLRTRCAHAAVTTGSWGEDPYSMGSCDSNGHMDNPFACISAGEWAYGHFVADVKKEAEERWGEVSHCFDAENKSMIPPTKADEPCVSAHGKHFRLHADGKCYDTTAPKGKQLPNQYDWSLIEGIESKADDGCTIL